LPSDDTIVPGRQMCTGPGTGPGPLCHLSELSPGARALVVGLVPQGTAATNRRLAALGFTAGTVVEVMRRAPLGDPVVYRLKDYEVCLRRAEAGRVRTREVGA
jgi:ferrous iron transport protein A